jgi:hypothetical protein
MNICKNSRTLFSIISFFSIYLFAERADLGINLLWPTDWCQHHAFADIIRTSRVWNYLGTWDPLPEGEKDAQGWPLVDATLFLWANREMQGTYRLSFTGEADVSIGGGGAGANIQNVTYDSTSNRTTGIINIFSQDTENFWINFENTAGGVSNVKLMRPLFPGSAESYPDSVTFTNAFKNSVEPFSTIRFMQFTGTNFSRQKTWDDRRRHDYYTFNDEDIDGGDLASWECVINMANELNKNAWINVPRWVDDDYVRQLAILFRDGNEFTNYQGLDENLYLYVEYSNEIWNYNQNEYRDSAVDVVLNDGDPENINFDNRSLEEASNGWIWAWRRPGARAVQISNIFREVFGDDAMMIHVRPVLCWQGVRHITSWSPLEYIEMTQVNPVNYYLYGGGGTTYYSPDMDTPGLTLDEYWESQSMNTDWWRDTWPDGLGKGSMMYNSFICNLYGIKRLAYEGGPNFDPGMPGNNDSVAELAYSDPRMRDEIIEHHNAWMNWGGELSVYYVLTNNYLWGFMDNIYDTTHPKYQGILDLASSEPPPVTIGNPVGTVDGNAFQLGYGSWRDTVGRGSAWVGSSWMGDNCWVSYMYNIPSEGFYEASINLTAGETISEVNWWVLGRTVATTPLTGFADTTGDIGPIIIHLTSGLHTIRVSTDIEGWTINSITLIPSEGTCSYSISPISEDFDENGGTGTIDVTASDSGCTWVATSNANWIAITSGSYGAGNGTVEYSVSQNMGSERTGEIMLAGQRVTITQEEGSSSGITLYPNSPNPFRTFTTINYFVEEGTELKLAVYDLIGREIKVLFEGVVTNNTHGSAYWDATDSEENTVESGVYFCHIGTSSGISASKKMILLK